MAIKLAQIKATTLSVGIGPSGTAIVLKELVDIYGNEVSMASAFGSIGYLTKDPGGASEEIMSFTGFTRNADGSVELSGVTRALSAVSPYASGGTGSSSAAGVTVVFSDNPQVFNLFAAKSNDESVTGQYTFSSTKRPQLDSDVDTATDEEFVTFGQLARTALAGAVKATATVFGLVKMSTAPADAANPIAVGDNDTRIPTQDENDAMAGGGSLGTPSTSNKFVTEQGVATTVTPPGIMSAFGGRTAPTGWLMCDGSAVSRTTYANLFAILCPSVGAVTITIAAPGVLTIAGHGRATGDAIYLTTDGALPTGLSANTRYYIIKNDANSFWLTDTLAHAVAGTDKITTTGSQSGTHTAHDAGYGIGDGSTTFNVPDKRGKVSVGLDQSQAEFAGVGQTGGEKTHTLTIAEMPAHNHSGTYYAGGTGNPQNPSIASSNNANPNTNNVPSQGGDGAHNNLQPYIAENWIIKT